MLTQLSATKYQVQVGSTVMILDSSVPNGLGVVHGQIIDFITGNPSDLAYLEDLLTWNSNFAFVSFCIQKGLVIPPDPVEETPSE